MDERRRHPRYRVSWRARIWLAENVSTSGPAIDASLHGLRVAISHHAPLGLMQPGHRYRVQVFAGLVPQFDGTMVLRQVSDQGIGMETEQRLPVTAFGERDNVVGSSSRSYSGPRSSGASVRPRSAREWP